MHRWRKCPGSVKLIADHAPPQESSINAKRGTAAHEVLEKCWPRGGRAKNLDDYVGWEHENGHEIDVDDYAAIDMAREILDAAVPVIDCSIHIHSEMRVELTELHPDLFGTADVVIEAEDRSILKVYDYKHGAGVPVNITYADGECGNDQLMYYALGAIANVVRRRGIDMDLASWGSIFDKVEIGIIQPRCYHADGPFRTWTVPPEKLNEFAKMLKKAALATQAENAPLDPGSHCRWCPAVSICPGIYKQTQLELQQDFKPVSDPQNLNPVNVKTMTPDQISKALRFKDVIVDWLKELEQHGRNLMDSGTKIDGFKLVQGRRNRKWKDEDDAKKKLGMFLSEDEYIKPGTLKSPAQVEKLLDKDSVKELCYKPEGGVVLAPESDSRKAVEASALIDYKPVS